MKKKVNVYVDGFNFYYGLKSKFWKQYYWLDIVTFFECFMKDDQQLNKVYYCTARPHDNGQYKRQDSFFTANLLNPKFELVFGKFLKKQVSANGKTINTYEEKQTDVNIAVRYIRNAVMAECDISIVVSGDSDLSPAIEVVRELCPQHKTIIHFPPKRQSVTLTPLADAVIHLERYESRFKKCLLAKTIRLPNGVDINCPQSWK